MAGTSPEIPDPPRDGKLAALAALDRAFDTAGMDASRSLYLVCYDVCNPRRLRRVHHFLLGFRIGGQKSFFECWFTPAELRAAEDALRGLIDPVEDRVHIFRLDPRMAMDGLGLAVAPGPTSAPFMVL